MEWQKSGNEFHIGMRHSTIPLLETAIYRVEANEDRPGLHLNQVADSFHFSYKIYDLDTELIDTVKTTYTSPLFVEKTMGVLLSGVKGSGKTVTAKQLCNVLKLPVLLVSQNFTSFPSFLNDIAQDVIVFIDEYEKVYDESESSLLSVMDGALSNRFRRVFLLTTNSLSVNCNLMSRPGRVRYLKKYKHLSLDVIMEVVDDLLIHHHHREATVSFISTLSTISIDVMKAVITEVNIHNKEPRQFEHIFNIDKLPKTYNLFEVTINEKGKELLTLKSSDISESRFYPYMLSQRYNRMGFVKEIINDRNIIVLMDDTETSKNVLKTFRIVKKLPLNDVFEIKTKKKH